MAPKRTSDVLGEVTPDSGAGDKKKDDTTPMPVVDKDVTPSEDDKKKKDSSTSVKKGSSSVTGGSQFSQHTQLSELSPAREHAGLSKQKDSRGSGLGSRGRRKMNLQKAKSAGKRDNTILNKKLKQLRKIQNKKAKHPRSFCESIKRILRSVNETQQDDHVYKHASAMSMMIFDSFANDLCDKLIATAVDLVKTSNKRQLGSHEIKSAMKLVLPNDMAVCAEEAVQSSLMSYKESTKKYQDAISKAKSNKKLAMGANKD